MEDVGRGQTRQTSLVPMPNRPFSVMCCVQMARTKDQVASACGGEYMQPSLPAPKLRALVGFCVCLFINTKFAVDFVSFYLITFLCLFNQDGSITYELLSLFCYRLMVFLSLGRPFIVGAHGRRPLNAVSQRGICSMFCRHTTVCSKV